VTEQSQTSGKEWPACKEAQEKQNFGHGIRYWNMFIGCSDLNIYVPPKFIVKILSLNVMVLRGKASGRS
jgi:hypothetical protein